MSDLNLLPAHPDEVISHDECFIYTTNFIQNELGRERGFDMAQEIEAMLRLLNENINSKTSENKTSKILKYNTATHERNNFPLYYGVGTNKFVVPEDPLKALQFLNKLLSLVLKIKQTTEHCRYTTYLSKYPIDLQQTTVEEYYNRKKLYLAQCERYSGKVHYNSISDIDAYIILAHQKHDQYLLSKNSNFKIVHYEPDVKDDSDYDEDEYEDGYKYCGWTHDHPQCHCGKFTGYQYSVENVNFLYDISLNNYQPVGRCINPAYDK